MRKIGAVCLFLGLIISQPRALAWPDDSAGSSPPRDESRAANEPAFTYYAEEGYLEPDLKSIREDRPKQAPAIATYTPEHSYYSYGQDAAPHFRQVQAYAEPAHSAYAQTVRSYSPEAPAYSITRQSPYVQTVRSQALAAEAASSPSPYIQSPGAFVQSLAGQAPVPGIQPASAKASSDLAYMPLPAPYLQTARLYSSKEQIVPAPPASEQAPPLGVQPGESNIPAPGTFEPVAGPYSPAADTIASSSVPPIEAQTTDFQVPASSEQFKVPQSFYRTSDDDFSSDTKMLQLPDPQLRSQVQVRLGDPLLQQPVILGQFAGIASWYGGKFLGRKTASGERFCADKLTAASPDLPFGTKLFIHNRNSGKSVVVTVNDRGPFVGKRVLDLSPAAASRLQMLGAGLANVEVQILNRGLMAVNEAAR